MEKLTKVLDTYGRYLKSLKNKETDVKTNYSAMKAFVEQNCDEWLRKHMLQDAFINSLMFNRGQYNLVEPSSQIKKLMKAKSEEELIEAVSKVKLNLSGETHEGFSWLPTLYKYFNPNDHFELNSMKMELGQMHKLGLVSQSDHQCVVMNVFIPREYRFKQELKNAMAE